MPEHLRAALTEDYADDRAEVIPQHPAQPAERVKHLRVRPVIGVQPVVMRVLQPHLWHVAKREGAERSMLRHSTGVDAKALGRLLTVVCAKEREQIWRIKEEK